MKLVPAKASNGNPLNSGYWQLKTSQQIGELVMKRLKSFDKVAYIRFASVYRSFEDVKTFQRELNSLLKGRRDNTDKKISKPK